jgi:Holliday junction resolvase
MLSEYLAAFGWRTSHAAPVGAPSILRLVAAARGEERAFLHCVDAGRSPSLKLDADELADLRSWAERTHERAYVAALFDGTWVVRSVARLQTTWVRRTDPCDDGL